MFQYHEQQHNQYELYFKYAHDHPEKLEEIKQHIINAGVRMDRCDDQVTELEDLLYSAGKGRALAQLRDDAPHTIKDQTPAEKQAAEEARLAEEAEAAAAAAAVPQKASKGAKGKDKGAAAAPVPVVAKKEEPPPETEAEIAAKREQKRQALAVLASEELHLRRLATKSQHLKAGLSTDAALLPAAAARHPRSTSVLRPADQDLEFFHELQEALRERGLDRMPSAYVVYRRLDMFKIIFKLAGVESVMKHHN